MRQRLAIYPHLHTLFKKKKKVAISVPSEHNFPKAGDVRSNERNTELIFLNKKEDDIILFSVFLIQHSVNVSTNTVTQ